MSGLQLHREELATLQNLADPHLRLKRVLAIWTLKEAFVKATGDGLHFDLKRLNVRFDENAYQGPSYKRIELDGKALQGWQFQLQQVDLGDEAKGQYWLAVALHGTLRGAAQGEIPHPAPTRPRFVELDLILSNAKSVP